MTRKVWIVTDLCDHEVFSVHRTFEDAKETVVKQLRGMVEEVWEEYVELGESDEFPVDTFDIESFILRGEIDEGS